MLKLVLVILHNLDYLPELLDAWKNAKVPGVTILQSAGGFQAEELAQKSGLAGLLSLFEADTASQRMIFSLIDDPEILEVAISEADRVVRGFDTPHSGILFTIDVGQALGLNKWSPTPQDDIASRLPTKENEEKGISNLVSWYDEEIKNLYGEPTLKAWKAKKKYSVSKVIQSSKLKSPVVHLDTPIKEVLAASLEDPLCDLVCVINTEDRLVGVIRDDILAEVMLVPTMPDSFIQDPEKYEQVLKFAQISGERPAAEVMSDPVFVNSSSTVEEAFIKMKELKLPGLPVVNKHYRVIGYITMAQILALYFPQEPKE
ncbi:MAG: CBS domain-containing protein [Chloroflexota bacterium]